MANIMQTEEERLGLDNLLNFIKKTIQRMLPMKMNLKMVVKILH